MKFCITVKKNGRKIKLKYKTQTMKKIALFYIFAVLILNACTSKYIIQVSPETKTKFGFEIVAPNKAVFFVENINTTIGIADTAQHKEIADRLYNKYGPSKDNFYVGRTNAKDFKFNLGNTSYYIDVKSLPRRNAVILFDGKHKPSLCFKPEKYEIELLKILKSTK